ncbi:uncharacterized protein LOC111377142 isoform X2 [Olea europaea var. sylvestris]|uniref:uncharacterized protein LOC111377142 isoform X2 n=1 Tax=Olea europaea var. sylvestris TaxID=158386 RepID=UPI000C1D6E87|nr:uncharacterized protein LOC111377142 isoform X2 [Olea europaea var. sylvestris]
MEENYVRKSTPASHGTIGALVRAPMEENYVQKRHATSATSHKMSGTLVPVATISISWVTPDQMTDFHFGEEGNFASEVGAKALAESLDVQALPD